MSPEQLMDRVDALTDAECRYALWWLASAGSDHPDGHALLHGLEAIEHRNDRLAELRSADG